MINKIENSVRTTFKRLGSNILPHSVQTSVIMPSASLQSGLLEAEQSYKTAQIEKKPYSLSIYNKDQDRYVKQRRMGFFTNNNLEIATVIDETAGEIRMGSLPIDEGSISTSSDLQIALPLSEVNPELMVFSRLDREVKKIMENLQTDMKQSPVFRLEIHNKLRAARTTLTKTSNK